VAATNRESRVDAVAELLDNEEARRRGARRIAVTKISFFVAQTLADKVIYRLMIGKKQTEN
jgi:hypothetical protein